MLGAAFAAAATAAVTGSAWLGLAAAIAASVALALVHGYAVATAWAAGVLVLGAVSTAVLIDAGRPAPQVAHRQASTDN